MALKLELDKVHIIEKVPGSTATRLVRIQPALQFRQDNDVIWMQRGSLFDGGGGPLDGNPPQWFFDQAKRCSDQALAECGFSKDKLSKLMKAN